MSANTPWEWLRDIHIEYAATENKDEKTNIIFKVVLKTLTVQKDRIEDLEREIFGNVRIRCIVCGTPFTKGEGDKCPQCGKSYPWYT